MTKARLVAWLALAAVLLACSVPGQITVPSVDAAQSRVFDDRGDPAASEPSGAHPGPQQKTSNTTPNFVVIVADDMGWTGTSVQMDGRIPDSKSDYYQTPHLEQLATDGMRFTRAYAPGPLCTPTRASLLTGRTPAALHVTTPGGGRSQEERMLLTPAAPRPKLGHGSVTIAETLKEAGYATATLGKWHLGDPDPGEQGFDTHDGTNANDGPGEFDDPNPKDIFGITERAVAFMTANRDTPFYLQLWHYAPHSPTRARADTVAMFSNMPRGDRHTDPAYAAMTYDLDASIGMVLDSLERLGLAESTYVVFMSDNGAAGGRRRAANNEPLSGGKGQLSEGGIRVPLIVRGPGVAPGAFCREPVVGTDLFSTFCEFARVDAAESIEGLSLVPLLTGTPEDFASAERSLLFHYPHYGNGSITPHSALIVGRYKIIRDYESVSVRLFDLERDVSEANDLASVLPAKAAELEGVLDDRLERVDAQMPTPNPDYDPDAATTDDRRDRRRPRR